MAMISTRQMQDPNQVRFPGEDLRVKIYSRLNILQLSLLAHAQIRNRGNDSHAKDFGSRDGDTAFS